MKAIEKSNGRDVSSRSCVWMDAGVVGYKLCSRNHQCVACQFDHRLAEIRERERVATPAMN
jgi:hypothetical protein